jgi:transcriptional regulator
MTDSSPEFISGMLKGVVGIEIVIKELVGSFKLGQNKKPADLQGAGENVIKAGNEALGIAMLNNLK